MKTLFRFQIIFLFFFLFATQSKAQFVAIPDSNFRAWLVNNGYASCMSGNDLDTTCPAVVNATKVNLYNKNINDLTGIEYFDNLDTLLCDKNHLTTLPVLHASLLHINCSDNDIASLPSLPASLLFLNCVSNQLTTLPSLPATLLQLYCSLNQITTLPSLPASLIELYCYFNSLTSLPNLPASLNSLYCQHNILSSLPVLPNALTHLRCRDNPLFTLPSLPDSLIWLDCAYDSLTSLPAIPAGLDHLECNFNSLTSLPLLPENMDYLSCSANPLGIINDYPDSLTFLDVSMCGLSNLVPLPTQLVKLRCSYNQLSNLPALPNSLIELYCENNQITDLLSYPPDLNILYCNNNLLTSLPTPLPTTLASLNCSYNLLTTLPSSIGIINYLICSNNLLTTIPSYNYLGTLYCDSNQITMISPMPSTLLHLHCSYNPITVLPELPDTMNSLYINDCPISCLPEIQKIASFQWSGSGLTCLANYVQVSNATPSMASLSLCQPSNNCPIYWNINGNVFKDLNSNCVNDSEPGLQYIPVKLDSAGITLQEFLTTADGNYSFHTYYGTYEVKIDTTDLPFDVTCPPAFSYTSVITPADPYDSLVDFALVCKPGYDLIAEGSGVNGIVRPGATRYFHLIAGDAAIYHGTECSTGLSGSVRAVFSGPVYYMAPASGALTPTSVNGDTLTWNVTDFSTSDPFHDFNVTAGISTTATIGDTVCIELNVDPTSGDNNPLNNSYTVCFPVVGSFDPNAKSMSPYGAVDTSQQWFTFTIYFQNTGNAPAEDIYLLDTISNNLDASTFVFHSSSHDVITQLLPGNVLRFNFPDINLVDSVANEPDSHGYVQFRMKRKQGLPPGTVISNTAYIYFDYNPPVITNTASATLTLPVSINEHNNVSIRIYPNPVDDLLYIDAGKTKFQHLEIMDVTGRLIYTKDFPNSTTSTYIDLSFLQSGIYFLKVNSGSQMYVEKVVIK